MYHQLTSEQRSQIFVLLQKKIARKEIALLIGCSQSTLSREIRRNSTERGNYLWDKAHKKAMERRKRTTANSAKDPAIVWEALDLLRSEDWSPQQIEAYMKERGRRISHELIYRLIRADASGELASHCRHKMKYNRHGRPDRTTKVRNIPERVSIHQRPPEADGTRFGDWEMGTIMGKDGKGAIVTLTERSTNMLLMEKLPEGKLPEPLAKIVIRLLFPHKIAIYRIQSKSIARDKVEYVPAPKHFYDKFFNDIVGVSHKIDAKKEHVIIRARSLYIYKLMDTKPLHQRYAVIKPFVMYDDGEYANLERRTRITYIDYSSRWM